MGDIVNKEDLILWLKLQKYGYFLDDGKTWINHGDLNDKFPYNEEDKKWELSRNRMIDKTINMLKYEDVNLLVSDFKTNKGL